MKLALLKKVKAHVLEEPARVNMNRWIMPYDLLLMWLWGDEAEPPSPSCGTVGCIAGWAVLLSEKKAPLLVAKRLRSAATIKRRARELLGLDKQRAARLFMPQAWPRRFISRLDRCKPGGAAYARVVADRIDHFIATGGAE